MKIIHHSKGAEFKFSWKERFTLFIKGELKFDEISLKHISNHLVKIASDFHLRMKEETQNTTTQADKDIVGR